MGREYVRVLLRLAETKATDSQLKIFNKINNEGKTRLMVTHRTKAESKAKRVLFLRDGEVFHQLDKGQMSDDEMYIKINDTLTLLLNN